MHSINSPNTRNIDSTTSAIWGEWPSGLRRCNQNRKVLGSNHTRRSAGLRDPTSLRGFPGDPRVEHVKRRD